MSLTRSVVDHSTPNFLPVSPENSGRSDDALGGLLKHLYRIALLAGIASLSLVVWAQNASTSLRGMVQDSSGAALLGAEITVVDRNSGQVLHSVSNAVGSYSFPVLPPSHYEVDRKS